MGGRKRRPPAFKERGGGGGKQPTVIQLAAASWLDLSVCARSQIDANTKVLAEGLLRFASYFNTVLCS